MAKETGADRRHSGVVRSVRPIFDPILPEADNRQGYLRRHTDNLLHPLSVRCHEGGRRVRRRIRSTALRNAAGDYHAASRPVYERCPAEELAEASALLRVLFGRWMEAERERKRVAESV